MHLTTHSNARQHVAEHGPPRRIQRRIVEEIAGVLVPRILEMSTEIVEKNDDNGKFYEQFGECSNPGNRECSNKCRLQVHVHCLQDNGAGRALLRAMRFLRSETEASQRANFNAEKAIN